MPEPKPSGAELTAAQMEELLLEKDERIDQLVRELADAKSALETTRLHLQERLIHWVGGPLVVSIGHVQSLPQRPRRLEVLREIQRAGSARGAPSG